MSSDMQQINSEDQQRLQMMLEEEFNSLTARLTTLSDPGKAESDPSDSHTQAALTGNTRRALAEVTQALRRMAEGRYGQCEQCGDQIPPERLEVLPHARFCLPCQSAAS